MQVMQYDLHALLDGLDTRPPASAEAIAACERALNQKLPIDYIEMLKLTNGGVGLLGDGGYVSLWPVEELPDWNERYEIALSVPGLVGFGSDGGGECYAFDLRGPKIAIVMIPFIGMEPDAVSVVASGFAEFLRRVRDEVD
jgi:cell wall assembly regulator SMI1